jgi:hypothetical protein
MRLKIATFASLGLGLLLFWFGIGRGWIIWLGFALVLVSGVLALWIKWGPHGWGWELRRARERSRTSR